MIFCGYLELEAHPLDDVRDELPAAHDRGRVTPWHEDPLASGPLRHECERIFVPRAARRRAVFRPKASGPLRSNGASRPDTAIRVIRLEDSSLSVITRAACITPMDAGYTQVCSMNFMQEVLAILHDLHMRL